MDSLTKILTELSLDAPLALMEEEKPAIDVQMEEEKPAALDVQMKENEAPELKECFEMFEKEYCHVRRASHDWVSPSLLAPMSTLWEMEVGTKCLRVKLLLI
jgi:hypothetical protein